MRCRHSSVEQGEGFQGPVCDSSGRGAAARKRVFVFVVIVGPSSGGPVKGGAGTRGTDVGRCAPSATRSFLGQDFALADGALLAQLGAATHFTRLFIVFATAQLFL